MENLVLALKASFSANQTERQEAEKFLAVAGDNNAGYLQMLLSIFARVEEPDIQLRQAAGVAAKNLIKQKWSRSVNYDGTEIEITPGQGEYEKEIPEQDKQLFKQHALQILSFTCGVPQLGSISAEMIKLVVHREFPLKWGNLIEGVNTLLSGAGNGADESSLMSGLMTARILAKEFELKTRGNSSKMAMDLLCFQTLPMLLLLGQKCLSVDEPTTSSSSRQRLTQLRFVLKSFYSLVMTDLPANLLQQPAICSAWLELVLKSAQLSGSQYKEGDNEEIEKVQKWALRIIRKFLSKHGNPKLVEAKNTYDDNVNAQVQFATWWLQNFAPVLVREVVSGLGGEHRVIVSPRNVNIALSFLCEAVQHAVTFKVLKPHLEVLLFHVIFPLMCFNDERKELWETDPEEYIRNETDCTSISFNDPRSAASDFVRQMVSLRSGEVLSPLLKFVEMQLTAASKASPLPYDLAVRKDGALALFSAISEQLCLTSTKKPKKKAVEKLPDAKALVSLLQIYVLPDFASPYGFLRYRACTVFADFVAFDLEFSGPAAEATLFQAFEGVFRSLSDRELPVRVKAGIDIKTFLDRSELTGHVQRVVLPILENLLKIMGETECEGLASSLENLVEQYSTDIVPFAPQAIEQLSKQFLRLFDLEEDEADMACMGVMSTIMSLIEGISTLAESPTSPSSQASKTLFENVTPTLIPLLDKVLSPSGIDHLQEGLDILSTLTYYLSPIPGSLWKYFIVLHSAVVQGWGIDYLDEMLNPFDNFISRGTEVFLTQQGPDGRPLTGMLFELVQKGLESVHEEAQVAAVRIAACIFESATGNAVDNQVSPYVNLMRAKLNTEKTDTNRWLMYFFAVVSFYNPVLVVNALAAEGAQFFTAFSELQEMYKNPDERKACVLAVAKILKSSESINLPSPVAVKLIEVLVAQTKNLPSLRVKYEEAKRKYEEESETDEWEDEDDLDIEDLQEDEDASNKHVDMYKKFKDTLAKFQDNEQDTESEFSIEDLERSTPLDNICEFTAVLEVLTQMVSSGKRTEWLGWINDNDLRTWHDFLQSHTKRGA
jgi:importin-7